MVVGVKYPLELDPAGSLSGEVNLPFERVLSVLLTEKKERPFHPTYGNPAPIFSNINRDTVEFPDIQDVETKVSVMVGGLIVAVQLAEQP